MAWTYLRYDDDGDYLPGEKEKLPPVGTVFLVFDMVRWKVKLGYIEPGGFTSICNPKVTDDCNYGAFAPLSETSEPNEQRIIESYPLLEGTRGTPVRDDDGVSLLR